MEVNYVPLVYINLGGEMFYVLYLRLKALKCGDDKISRVIGSMAVRLFNEKTLDELFKKTAMQHAGFKSIYKILIESSAITIPESSMTTLYDLMTMVFKYQVFAVKKPEHILLVTLNHMDKMRQMCPVDDECVKTFSHLHAEVIARYSKLLPKEFRLIKEAIMNFFKDSKVKVSVLVKQGKQGDNGEFIGGKEEDYGHGVEKASLAFDGDRVIELGNNIYEGCDKVQVKSSNSTSLADNYIQSLDPKYKAEVDYLLGLIGAPKEGSTQLKINLGGLMDDEDDDDDGHFDNDLENISPEGNFTTHIKAGVHTTSHLSKVLEEMRIEKDETDAGDVMQFFD